MTTYMLDSNTLSAIMERQPRALSRLDMALESDWVIICPVVRGEILFGLERMPPGQKRRAAEAEASAAFGFVECVSLPEHAADIYARIKRDAEINGTTQGENDLWIAAVAVETGSRLLSDDSHFDVIPGVFRLNG